MTDVSVTITEDVTSVSIEADTEIVVTEDVVEVDITATTPVTITGASGISFAPYGTVASSNVQSALQELSDQFNITTSQPGSPSEGDLFYDTDDDVLQVYADADGSTQWLTILRAGAADDMQRLDGGSF
jgi:hypothetical protein|tara:strand:+ start:1121 stop:1507 length:387 start_codon:yes stop_codon:yes gene_type:complete